MSQTKAKRVVLLILDSVGVGAMPDAKDYNDPPNCFTIGNVASACQGLELPNLQKLGLGNIAEIEGVQATETPQAFFGKMAEQAPGKDTTTGHWELAGSVLKEALTLYPNGFPKEIIQAFEEQTGRKVIANRSASGTVIIDELAEEQARTGSWIVYTSADSVFQIAAHEEVIPLEELYAACEFARNLLDPYRVGRVIARPYLGEKGSYQRTSNRKDYAMLPPSKTILDHLEANGIEVTGVGKIANIFSDQGITHSFSTKNNLEGIQKTIEALEQGVTGLLFVNLVDFDSKFGHRNNPLGYGKALEEFDQKLPLILSQLNDDDLLIITADHGCDPTVPGTDHSREYIPLLAYQRNQTNGSFLGTRSTFADVAQSIASYWKLKPMPVGTSFFPLETGAI